MKILLSAYACRPNHGSEPAVGWNWAIELAKKGYEVTVVTRKDNEVFINTEKANIPGNINFIYYELPSYIFALKKYVGIYIYYSMWQAGAYRMLKGLFPSDHFDIIQHLTYVSYRFPVFIQKLKGKFILGPIAGGEEATPALIDTLDSKHKRIEKLRKLINSTNRFNIFINNAYKMADKIYVTTEETFEKIPSRYYHKTIISPAIGINIPERKSALTGENFTILYAGQLLHWKGIHLAILSFSKLLKKHPKIRFKIIGSGKFKPYLIQLCKQLEVLDKIQFIEKLPQQQLFQEYQNASVFLFPSFHDSGGFVVLEAMSYGLPVICLDRGGPPIFVGKETKNVITTKNKEPEQIISEINNRLDFLISNPDELMKVSEEAFKRAELYNWEAVVDKVYKEIN